MEQVSGRAGRADGIGRVLIQAYNLTHPVLQWVKDHDIDSYYKQEIKHREFFAYPPFSRLIKISFKHQDEPKAIAAATAMAEALHTLTDIIVQGPGPAIVPRVRNLYIQEIWIKCPRSSKTIDAVKAFLKEKKNEILGKRGNGNVQIVFDVDPM
jgi:primosomal protein N' (replication factor Y)